MSSAPPSDPPSNPPTNNNPEKQPEVQPADTPAPAAPDGAAMDTTPDQPPEESWDDIPADIMALNTDEMLTRIRLIDNDIKVRVPTQGHTYRRTCFRDARS
jgi:26S proteasome regulatory subunit T5